MLKDKKSPFGLLVIGKEKPSKEKSSDGGSDPELVIALEDLAQHLKDEDFDAAAECFRAAVDACMRKEDDDSDSYDDEG